MFCIVPVIVLYLIKIITQYYETGKYNSTNAKRTFGIKRAFNYIQEGNVSFRHNKAIKRSGNDCC